MFLQIWVSEVMMRTNTLTLLVVALAKNQRVVQGKCSKTHTHTCTLKTPAMTKTWSRVRGSWNSPESRESRSSLTARAPAGRRKIPRVHEPSW